MTRLSPTARSLAKLRADGWLAAKVERREGPNSHDLFGIADIFALLVGPCVLEGCAGHRDIMFVQATSAPNIAARVKKIADNPNIGTIREAGIAIQVWGWYPKPTAKYPDGLRVVDVS